MKIRKYRRYFQFNDVGKFGALLRIDKCNKKAEKDLSSSGKGFIFQIVCSKAEFCHFRALGVVVSATQLPLTP